VNPASPSVAVIGGGIIGMSIAWRLARQDARVTVFDRSTVGGESSWAAAGMLAPGGEVQDASPLASLAMESRALYPAYVRELETASGLAIDYQECGGLDLAYSSEEWDRLETRAAQQSALGIESKPLSAKQLKTFWPRIEGTDLAGGRFYPGDAIVNPREVVIALAAACHKRGVEVRQHSPVTHLAVRANAVEIESNGERTEYTAAVLATGAWSSAIPLTGVPSLPAAYPVKGHLIGYHQPAQTCNTILRHGHTYLLQRANGLLIAGASVEHVGFDRNIEPARVAALTSAAAAVLPHLSETIPTETWIGFRPGSEEIHLGPWHSPRFHIAYGHFRNGILLAPLTAERITSELGQFLAA